MFVMLRIGPAAGYDVSQAAANTFIRGKRRSDGAVAALAVTGAFVNDACEGRRRLEDATFCAIDKARHNM